MAFVSVLLIQMSFIYAQGNWQISDVGSGDDIQGVVATLEGTCSTISKDSKPQLMYIDLFKNNQTGFMISHPSICNLLTLSVISVTLQYVGSDQIFQSEGLISKQNDVCLIALTKLTMLQGDYEGSPLEELMYQMATETSLVKIRFKAKDEQVFMFDSQGFAMLLGYITGKRN